MPKAGIAIAPELNILPKSNQTLSHHPKSNGTFAIPRQSLQSLKGSKYLISASQRPDVVGVSLAVDAHEAVVEVYVPRVVRVGGKRGRRPVGVRLYARERITFFPRAGTSRIGEYGLPIIFPIYIFLINHRYPLLFSR